ncbi:hypothetical protein D3C80_1616180 [compost metagenome]
MAVQDQSQVLRFRAIGPEALRTVGILWIKHRVLSINYCRSINHAESKHLLGANLQLRFDVTTTSNIWIGEAMHVLESHPCLRSCSIELETFRGCTGINNDLSAAIYTGV